ncbi:MAG: hypothetical protein IJ583_16990 [Firmicutes bacterium]|nr:hypothetical protein [Bacillota bacterium]
MKIGMRKHTDARGSPLFKLKYQFVIDIENFKVGVQVLWFLFLKIRLKKCTFYKKRNTAPAESHSPHRLWHSAHKGAASHAF